ncbi:hypothetical protein PNOK_0665500 [Pyrrhoderma noxium]|uniref:Protein kinase domain-containing protein n=1 Tax=Pyrrhoderma noxium TaxID=2282107 RepID=A0A286UF75_9AGAM|nr:hypothetical protein PNOK_0665500 [Pyrrhoderma noxium]
MSCQQTRQKFKEVFNDYEEFDLSEEYKFNDIIKKRSLYQWRHLCGYGEACKIENKSETILLPWSFTDDSGKLEPKLKDACELFRKLQLIDRDQKSIPHIRGFVFGSEKESFGFVFNYIPEESTTLPEFLGKDYSENQLLTIILGVANGLKAMHDVEIVLDWILPVKMKYQLRLPTRIKGAPADRMRWYAPEYSDNLNDSKSNIWQFGMVLYVYEKPEKPSKMTKFQEELWKLCERCWTKPEERPTMSDMVGDLNSLKEV